MDRDRVDDIVLRMARSDKDDQAVPLALLARVLTGLQQVVYDLALQEEDGEFESRIRLPARIADRYALRALPATAGSYVQATTFVASDEDLFLHENQAAVQQKYLALSRALAEQNADSIRSIIPDRRLRKRLLRHTREMLPAADSGWTVSIVAEGGHLEFDALAVAEVIGRIESEDRSALGSAIIGKVVGIDFEAAKLTLRYPPTQRIVRCFYLESVEEMLLRSPRELVQVIGEVTLDEEGNPTRISEVEDIRDVDLSPLSVSRVRTPDGILHLTPPLQIDVNADESYQFLVAVDAELGIEAMAVTREELLEEIERDIDVQWRTYALAPDDDLTPNAQRRKHALRIRIREVTNATK